MTQFQWIFNADSCVRAERWGIDGFFTFSITKKKIWNFLGVKIRYFREIIKIKSFQCLIGYKDYHHQYSVDIFFQAMISSSLKKHFSLFKLEHSTSGISFLCSISINISSSDKIRIPWQQIEREVFSFCKFARYFFIFVCM